MSDNRAVEKALKVMVLTPHIREYLEQNDPKALEQAVEALTVESAGAHCETCEGTGWHKSLLYTTQCWDCGGSGKKYLVFPTGCPSEGTQGNPPTLVTSKNVPALFRLAVRVEVFLGTIGSSDRGHLNERELEEVEKALKDVMESTQ